MGYFQCRSPPRQMASDGGEKMFDPVLFDVTRIPADDIATQITKEDFEVFQNIRPDEVRTNFHFESFIARYTLWKQF